MNRHPDDTDSRSRVLWDRMWLSICPSLDQPRARLSNQWLHWRRRGRKSRLISIIVVNKHCSMPHKRICTASSPHCLSEVGQLCRLDYSLYCSMPTITTERARGQCSSPDHGLQLHVPCASDPVYYITIRLWTKTTFSEGEYVVCFDCK